MARKRAPRFEPAWPGQIPSLGYELVVVAEDDLGITLTNEQAARLVKLYELDPKSGRRLVRRAALRAPKGKGKSPEAGFVSYLELVADVMFDRWDDDGQPVGRPREAPWIQMAAVSEDQTDNVSVWLFDILSDRPDTLADRSIDLGRTRIYLHDRAGRLEPVTSSGDSREGQRITFAALDQTEAWRRTNGGIALAATLRRNAGKMGGWTYELQNAPEPDDGSVADLTGKAAGTPGVYFDTVVPPRVDLDKYRDPATPPAQRADARRELLDALSAVYGEAAARPDPNHPGATLGWVDLERIADEAADPDTDPSDIFRYYLNTPEVATERCFDRARWADIDADPIPEGRFVTAGFAGTRTDAAIVVTDIATGEQWTPALWAAGDTDVPPADVDAEIAYLFKRWDVWRLNAAPSTSWRSAINAWAGTHGTRRVVEWWINRSRQMGLASRDFAQAIRTATATRVPDADFDAQIGDAVREPVKAYDDDRNQLWVPAPSSPGRPLSAVRAAVLSWEARELAVRTGAKPKKRTRAVVRSW